MVYSMPIPDPNYVALFPIQEVIIDKDTGLPLSAGVVTFYEDNDRTVLKPIYEQVQNPDNTYDFAEINNPITLTSVGTFADDSGNDIIPFLYPYTGLPSDPVRGALDLYYITVYAPIAPVGTGALQFTREAWPPNVQDNASSEDQPFTANELSNPQFVEVLFNPLVGLTFSVSGSGTVSPIAPDWDIVTNGSGSITVNQVAIIDPTVLSNPPYVLDITSSGITSPFVLRQRIVNSPRLLANGTVAGYLVASSQDQVPHALTLSYVPSDSPTGSSYTIASGTAIASGTFTPIFGSVDITGVLNADSATTGYIDIQLTIPTGARIQVSSFQLVGVPSLQDQPAFIQLSTPRQIDQLFHYWKPKLEYKPIPSYTIGWDFRFNPCQELGFTVAAASGLVANNARYIADQTVSFESVQNVMNYTFSSNGMTATTGSTTTQFALIQYLDVTTAFEILSQRNAIRLRGKISSGSVTGQVNIYWSANSGPSVPVLPASLITTLTLGVPTVAVGWTAVPRGIYGPANFTLNTTTNSVYDFSWFDSTAVNTSTATALAIVVSFNAITSSQTVGIDYISLVAGDIPTPPAPLSKAQTLAALQTYYETSFLGSSGTGTFPVTYPITLVGALSSYQVQVSNSAQMIATPWSIAYKVTKRAIPTAYTVGCNNGNANYVTPIITAATGGIRYNSPDIATPGLWTLTTTNQNVLYYNGSGNNVAAGVGGSGNFVGNILYQYVADARFGVV